MLYVTHDQGNNRLYLEFVKDRLIARQKWIADNATMDFAHDGSVIGVTIYHYYSAPIWPLTSEHVEEYHLGEWLDDLRACHDAFFTGPRLGVKEIKYEGPDGNEVAIKPE